jgi:2-oxoisovalerate dehydrogenase E2 component (dihydrolipoyl transacylase)
MKQFKLPDVGEGLTEAEIVSWKVKPGDTVKVNEIVVEIETAKSLVELPSPFAGVVTELLVPEGTTVDVGTPIITVDTGEGGVAPSTDEPSTDEPSTEEPSAAALPRDDLAPPIPAAEDEAITPAAEQAVEAGLIGGPAPGGRTSVLVGYGPRTTSAVRRPRKGHASGVPTQSASAAAARQAVQTSMMTIPVPLVEPSVDDAELSAPATTLRGVSAGEAKVLAKPPVRKLAKDLGVDLSTVPASGPGGTVTRDDVEAVASGATGATASTGYADDGGERETRVPIKGVRKMIAQAMVASAFTAPHVTEWITIDVTRTMDLVDRLKADRAFRDVKVSPLLLVAKALILAIKRNPEISAAWDEANQEIVYKRYINLGIAAATPRGLIVPNMKDADRMSLLELAQAMGELTATAREGRTQPAETAGGTITITNVGVFGVDSGTPILNPGESAILCFGAVRDMPWVVDGEIAVRKVTQLALSFDHRLIDGELGSRFLSDIARVLEDPATALLW